MRGIFSTSHVLWVNLLNPESPVDTGVPAVSPPNVDEASRAKDRAFVRLNAGWWLLWLNGLPVAAFVWSLLAGVRGSPLERILGSAFLAWLVLVVGAWCAAYSQRLSLRAIYHLAYGVPAPVDWPPMEPSPRAAESLRQRVARLATMLFWGMVALAVFLLVLRTTAR